jgi:hypothetical protein
MFCGRSHAVLTLTAVTLLAILAAGQSVISTHSGVIHFFEGSVYLGDQPLESHPGKFSSVPQGGELRTASGRAEVLLTPGVFLRMGDQTSIRMVANQLSDTRVELLRGSVIVDSAQPGSGTSVTLLYKDWRVHFPEQGVFRIDSDPPRLWVFNGKAEVSGSKGDTLLVGPGKNVPFTAVLAPNQSIDRPHDALSQWTEGRQQSIFADNTIAANIQDPASLTPANAGIDTLTYFPMLGLPSTGPASSSLYSSFGTYQPGFNSVYFPGYTFFPGYAYLPMFPGGLIPAGFATSPRSPYVGGLPVGSNPIHPVHSPIGSPLPVRPGYPSSGLVSPIPIAPHPMPVSPVISHPAPVSPVSPRPAPVHPTAPAAARPVTR